ncbi:MAG: aminoacyl-tRNA hydrolase [Spirochaetaceae bacterium]|nr:aminoacyl-tRNA hydrolase [Spirochaetaceae bacterium]
MNQKKLILLLGNPGKEYNSTRHNVPWRLCDVVPSWKDLSWKEKFKGQYSNDGNFIILKPHTLMNLSGNSLSAAMDFFKITPDDILVIHDDLELPFGKTAWKLGGGLGGHNGLKSVKQHLHTEDFLRLRIGIGRPVHGAVSNWVLSPFSAIEESQLSIILQGCVTMVENYYRGELPKIFKPIKWIEA